MPVCPPRRRRFVVGAAVVTAEAGGRADGRTGSVTRGAAAATPAGRSSSATASAARFEQVLWSAGLVAAAEAETEAAATAAGRSMVRGGGGCGAGGSGGNGGGAGGGGAAEPEAAAAQTAAPADIRARAHRLCSEYLRGAWRDATPSQLVIRKISGGLSNLLFEVVLPSPATTPASEYAGERARESASTTREATPSRVLLRLYGQLPPCGVDCARDGLVTEAVVFTLLSESQRGPRLLGVFPGGRLEEYIPARPLLTKELNNPRLSPLIAEKMAQIHMMNVPINKEPHWLWDTMERWLDNINAFMCKEEVLPQFKAMCSKLAGYDLKAEFCWLKKFLVEVNSPVVFCHNDLQEGNILLRNESNQCNGNSDKSTKGVSDNEVAVNDSQLVVIDFEYCAYNYRGFDFANHMCEWTYDYSNENHPYFWARPENFPSREQQELFFNSYLQTIESEHHYDDENIGDVKSEIERMLEEAKAFTLASHFFWGLWSVVNATVSKITFDYWAYGEDRFKNYFNKKSILKNKSTEVSIAQTT